MLHELWALHPILSLTTNTNTLAIASSVLARSFCSYLALLYLLTHRMLFPADWSFAALTFISISVVKGKRSSQSPYGDYTPLIIYCGGKMLTLEVRVGAAAAGLAQDGCVLQTQPSVKRRFPLTRWLKARVWAGFFDQDSIFSL